MFVDLFIRRPVLATVTALFIVIGGVICLPLLPVAEFPSMRPPNVSVNASYIGANAQTIETAVTQPLEQAVNGVLGLKYIQSNTSTSGVEIDATFDVDRDQDLAVQDTQTRVNKVLGLLPPQVRQLGVSVSRQSGAYLMTMALETEGDKYSIPFLSNYADIAIVPALKRLPGVANCFVEGERKYAIRVWLDPLKLAARKLTARDVLDAISEQNVQVSAGVIGAPPAAPDQAYELPVRALGRLTTPEEFAALVIKVGADGTLVQLRDVARVELGAEDYSSVARYQGKENVAVGATVLASANALQVRDAIVAKMAELQKSFPPGLTYSVPFDSTRAVSASLTELIHTLLASIVLVILVILFFLQSFRGTLISAITIPVSLIGTFIFIKLFGFSINTLTLFGLTLATGLVVDDAIVVIENIERHLEAGQSRAEAASLAMREVTGAVLATSLVLIAVFVPMAFFPGFTGRLYKQFALTIAFSVAISTFNALTLTPSLSALLLKHEREPGGIFGAIKSGLRRLTGGYEKSLAGIERHWPWALLLFAVGLGGTAWLLRTLPRTIAPQEDRSYFMCGIQGPEGSSLERTVETVKQVEKVIRAQPELEGVFVWVGGGASNSAFGYVSMKPVDQRPGEEHSSQSVIRRLRKELSVIPGAMVNVFSPAPIDGLGETGGFTMQLLDQGSESMTTLAAATADLVKAASADKKLDSVFTDFAANDPQLVVDVDRARAKSLNVPFDEIADALQIEMGSAYVNDFEMNNRAYRVFVQADQQFRAEPKAVNQLYVRSTTGTMLPLQNLVKLREEAAPTVINHYDLFRTAAVTGDAAPGVSSGTALLEMERLAHQVLPAGISFEWTGIALEELASQKTTGIIFGLTLLFVFLVLAALYESFILPVIILIAVPLALLGALGAQMIRGLTNDVYCQIGLVMLIGLASKNAILIVEFAEQLRHRGRTVIAAAIEASKERLRPILMTSFAFILGMLPLVFAGAGAGANSRRSLGTAVAGGMVVSTLLNLFITPVFYVVIQSLRQRLRKKPEAEAAPHA